MSDALPPHHAAWLSAALPDPLPAGEPRATCQGCAMCDRTADGSPKPMDPLPEAPFDPRVTCCTYVPVLPNYLVGRILADTDPGGSLGRDTVRARIRRHLAVTPLGLDWPHAQGELYRDRDRHFGRDPRLRCPHHVSTPDGGRCGIWRHRNAICATWFCKHERGQTGRRFWMALRDVATAIEHRLAWHCVDTLGIEPERRDLLVPRPGLIRGAMIVDGHPGGEPTDARRRLLWGEWFDREEAYYAACAEIVAPLEWSDVRRIGGTALRDALHALETARQALERAEPPRDPRARPGSGTVVHDDGETAWIRGYSAYDPLAVPSAVVPLLRELDGRPLEVVRDRLGRAADVLTDAVVRALTDWGIVE